MLNVTAGASILAKGVEEKREQTQMDFILNFNFFGIEFEFWSQMLLNK